MKKICFISIGNIYTTPYINVYINNLQKLYDIIYWNRDNITENINADMLYPFKHSSNSYFKKILGYLKFSIYCKNILKKNDYDMIIFLGTIPCILNYFNIFSLNFNYIIDVRDYTLENNKIFYKIERKCFKNSKAIVISSPAYRLFLPKGYNYLELHNIQKFNYFTSNKTRVNPINISYIGTITYLEENKKIIDYFANDNRFKLSFIGKNSEILKKYCEEKNINNVFFKGRFLPDEILNYYKDTDVILNAYGNHNPKLDYALSNKLYFATYLHLPIIVNKDTYMETISKELGIGMTFSELNDLKKEIINFKLTADIEKKLEEFNNEIIKTNEKTLNEIKHIINKNYKENN